MTAAMTVTAAAVGHGSTLLWYLTRSTGLMALVVLTASVVVGVVASIGWTTAALAALPLPGRAPEPVALRPRAGRRPHPHHHR